MCCWNSLVNFLVHSLHSSSPKFLLSSFFIFSISLLKLSFCSCIIFFSAHWASLWRLFWIICWEIYITSFLYGWFLEIFLCLWLDYFPLFLHVPYNFVLVSMHLKRQSPLLIFIDWLCKRKRHSPISLARDFENFWNVLYGCIFSEHVAQLVLVLSGLRASRRYWVLSIPWVLLNRNQCLRHPLQKLDLWMHIPLFSFPYEEEATELVWLLSAVLWALQSRSTLLSSFFFSLVPSHLEYAECCPCFETKETEISPLDSSPKSQNTWPVLFFAPWATDHKAIISLCLLYCGPSEATACYSALLFLVAPRQPEYSGSHQHSKKDQTEADPLGSFR